MRAYSAWVPPARVPTKGSPWAAAVAQREGYPARQISHSPQEMQKEPTTKSPGLTVVTAEPTSVTVPTYSWPMRCSWTYWAPR